MRSANEKKMFDLLLDEIEDTLQDIEQRCLKLESSDQSKELQVIFRSAHNVKGAAQLYGLTEFGAFVHVFEDLLTTLQKLQRPVTAQSVDVLLNAQSFFRTWIEGLRENEKFLPETSHFKLSLTKHIEELKAARNAAAAAPKPSVTGGAPVATAAPSPTPSGSAPSNPSVLPSTPANATPKDRELATAIADALSASAPSSPADGNKKNRRTSSTLRISSQKIDEIMQLIGELSIHQGILWHNFQNNTFNSLTCKNAVTLNHKTLKDLYELVLTLRMQTAENLYQRMERTARDVARDQKKKISIHLVGADTPLDKTVVELITDPMMHIIRNAIDHGIEDDETRLKLGKTVPAKITIQTQQDSGQVVISISDDGRGLDPQMIHEKAVKKGLVPAGKPMKNEDIIQLLFLPGFSTREQVTAISGRGVGMDIVQKAIQQLGGRIEISSVKGNGTTFEISLPASLEIIEGLMVLVTDQLYIIPRQDVEEIVDLDSFEVENIGRGGRAIRMRKAVVPVEELSDYIGLFAGKDPDSKPVRAKDSAKDIALLIRLPDRTRLALRIDAVVSQQQIVVRPLADHLAKVPGFTGVTILGNGEPAMILSSSAIGESYLRWVNRNQGKNKESA